MGSNNTNNEAEYTALLEGLKVGMPGGRDATRLALKDRQHSEAREGGFALFFVAPKPPAGLRPVTAISCPRR